jgi:glycosyltransferase involved in cell wall biosynthesis
MLTVLLATRNGSRTLPAVLEAFTRLESPSSGWKLVVADNGSTDQTREIVGSFRERLPLTYVFEERPGKNVALNAGLEHLEGDLAVFTDDDVFPHPDWLIRLRAAADAHLAYSMFGGAVRPRWEVAPPYWLQWVNTSIVFAITDAQMVEGPIDPHFLFGPNMAIRAEVFKGGIRFNTAIGPRGNNYPMGSETELVLRLSRQGHSAWHVPDAVVQHFIREDQMNKPWVLRRAIRFGRGRFRLSQTADATAVPGWFGIPVNLFFKLLKKSAKTALAWLSLNERAVFVARWEFNYFWGHIIEARVIRRERYARSKTDNRAPVTSLQDNGVATKK